MQAPYLLVRSAVPGVTWPAITRPEDAIALALQYQLERSQWLPSGELAALQLRQLDALAGHAWLTAPFYRWRWHGSYDSGAPLTRETFERLPVFGAEDLLHDYETLKSSAPPAAHGAISERRITRSTGAPARMLDTALTGLWQQALALRDHLWHGRDFNGTLATIGADVAEGETAGWGPESAMIAGEGRTVALGMRTAMDAQLEWLQRHDPHYLWTSPGNAAALARSAMARGVRLPTLREIRTAGEALEPETRELCREAWGVPSTGFYSTVEAGCVALQCPDYEYYHVQSESVLVEVLDEKGRACAPGATGRIVVTALQNFAMPLVRYDTGDRAEVGDPCPCGRGLPVLRRIMGAANAPASEPPRAP